MKMIINKICPCCGSKKLIEGEIRSANSLRLVFCSEGFTKKHEVILSYKCKSCGFVSMFSPIEEEGK